MFLNDSATLLADKLGLVQLYLLNQMFYSPVLLDGIYEFQRQYPDSEHLDYYQGYIASLKESVKTSTEEFDQAIFIQKKYRSFRDLIPILRARTYS